MILMLAKRPSFNGKYIERLKVYFTVYQSAGFSHSKNRNSPETCFSSFSASATKPIKETNFLDGKPFEHLLALTGARKDFAKFEHRLPEFPKLQKHGKPINVFIVAGEPSGDAIGFRFMRSLQIVSPNGCKFYGVGGPLMERHNFQSLFPMSDLSSMGIMEVLVRLPKLFVRLQQARAAVLQFNPDVVITIDSKGFSFRLLSKLKGVYEKSENRLPLFIHYVAPSFWAWKGGETSLPRWAAVVDHMLCILPFEPATCHAHGLAASFVRHPVCDEIQDGKASGIKRGDRADLTLSSRIGTSTNGPLLCLLPGSRMQEIQRMLPIMKLAVQTMSDHDAKYRKVSVIIPTVAATHDFVVKSTADWKFPVEVLADDISVQQKYTVFASCDAAVCASGTAAVQLMMSRLPCIVIYKAHPLTEYFAKWRAKVKYISLPNILLDKPVIPEVLFSRCIPETVAARLKDLLESPHQQESQRKAATELSKLLGCCQNADIPTELSLASGADSAARIVLEELEKRIVAL